MSGSLWSVTEACGILRMLVVCDGSLWDVTFLNSTPANVNRFCVSGSLWSVTEACCILRMLVIYEGCLWDVAFKFGTSARADLNTAKCGKCVEKREETSII